MANNDDIDNYNEIMCLWPSYIMTMAYDIRMMKNEPVVMKENVWWSLATRGLMTLLCVNSSYGPNAIEYWECDTTVGEDYDHWYVKALKKGKYLKKWRSKMMSENLWK